MNYSVLTKEWLLCIASYGAILVRGRARVCKVPPRRVIVWQMAKLGDMVCTTPVFRALKRAYPEIHVTVVGNAINKQVLEGNTDVDDYIVFDGFMSVLRRIYRDTYDTAFVTGPSVIAIATLFLGGVRCIVAPKIENGLSPYETSAYRLFLMLVLRAPHRMGSYAPREYLRLLEHVDIYTDDTTKHLHYSDVARRSVHAFLREHYLTEGKFAIISPSVGNKIKRWPADRFARVAKYLVSRGVPVVVIGGSRDGEEVEDMMRAVENQHGIISAPERFSIDELKALIAYAALFIAVDTGPIYIAEAFGTPTVDIVGPMDEREQPPYGDRHRIVVPPGPRVPQLHIMNTQVYDRKEARRQTEAITVAMVVEACEKLMPR